ncbi:MAG: NUDIX domain-containing protein [Firmicutes bacterium]|nr:NUDIX domain-containing protein [Bacillota bacterium]
MRHVIINDHPMGLTDGKYFYSRTASQVYLLRTYKGRTQVLLQLRSGKIGNGSWDCSSAGHCDELESFTTAAKRECREEIGIQFDDKDILFTTIIHVGNYNNEDKSCPQFVNAHFFVKKFKGTPKVCECDKVKCIEWFDINDLPEKMFADRREAISNFIKKITYSEIMWKKD